MTTKDELIEQSNLAFEFIQKLYLETSYLIKEIETILSEESEEFIIGRPGGYGITCIKSSGLESGYVKQWLMRKFAVFFVPKDSTVVKGGHKVTPITNGLKVMYLRFILNDDKLKEPTVYIGVLYSIKIKRATEKFEQLMAHFEYHEHKIFTTPSAINYEDIYFSMKGELIKRDLFDITDSFSIRKKLIEPALSLYRKER